MIRTYVYKCYPSKKVQEKLETLLDATCSVYNWGLEKRITNHKAGIKYGFNENSAEFTKLRKETELKQFNYSLVHPTLRRLDKSYKAFFRRVKAKDTKKGFPKFKPRKFWRSIEGTSRDLKGSYLSSVGNLRIKFNKEVPGKIKAFVLTKKADGWFICLQCEIGGEPPVETTPKIGIDLGLTDFITTSDNEIIKHERYYEQYQKERRRLQRSIARCKRGSLQYKERSKKLKYLELNVARKRSLANHKTSKYLSKYDGIATEKLSIEGMKQKRFGKQISDVAWGDFISKLSYKTFVKQVDPAYTTQECSNCGNIEKKELSERKHLCKKCGYETTRDHNAAQVILKRAL